MPLLQVNRKVESFFTKSPDQLFWQVFSLDLPHPPQGLNVNVAIIGHVSSNDLASFCFTNDSNSMKRVSFILSGTILLMAAFAYGFVLSDASSTSSVVTKPNSQSIVVGGASKSYCCTFSDGTDCYSNDCSECGCSGLSPNQMQVQAIVGTIDIDTNLPQAGSGKQKVNCCSFADGTACFSNDCSLCGCY